MEDDSKTPLPATPPTPDQIADLYPVARSGFAAYDPPVPQEKAKKLHKGLFSFFKKHPKDKKSTKPASKAEAPQAPAAEVVPVVPAPVIVQPGGAAGGEYQVTPPEAAVQPQDLSPGAIIKPQTPLK